MRNMQLDTKDDRLQFLEPEVICEQRSDGSLLLITRMGFQPTNALIHDYLKHWASERPNAVFLAERSDSGDGWRTVTYAETYATVSRLSAVLSHRELGPDRPILIISGNDIDHQVMALAAMAAGIPYTPLSVAYSTMSEDLGKLRNILRTLDPGLVFASNGVTFKRALTIPEMDGRDIVVGEGADVIPHALALNDLVNALTGKLATTAVLIGPDTVAKILFTSGSTGTPKGVPTTHRMMSTSLCQFEALWPFLADQRPIILDWLPWSHVFGGSYSVNTVLRYGGTLYIDDGKPMPTEIGRTARNLRDVRPTMYWNVPKGYELLLPHLRQDRTLAENLFADLNFMLYAGASLPAPLWKELVDLGREVSGRAVPMTTSWGLTETAPSITLTNRLSLAPGEIGIPMPGLEIKLVPHQGKMEARVRGPTVMPGYWKMPEATAAAFDEEGFFKTGDAVLFSHAEDPSRGVVFDGRTTEDFKLLTGTWVDTATVRAKANIALSGIASDVVITGADRNDVGILIIAQPNVDPSSPAVWKTAGIALAGVNHGATGASQRISRAVLLQDRPTFDAGEITEKGSLNMRLIRERRQATVERLYRGVDPDIILIN